MIETAAVHVTLLEHADPTVLDQIEPLLMRMYDYMNGHGLLVRLAPGGEKLWRRGLARSLGRFSALAVATRDDGTVVGFAHGAIGMVPEYLGGGVVAQINHVYVEPDVRGQKLTTRMIDSLTDWFRRRGARSIEMQVLYENEHAIEVWERLGFQRELFQLRWFIGDE